MTAPPGDEQKQHASDYKECSFRHWPYNLHRRVVLDAPLLLTCTTIVWLRITCLFRRASNSLRTMSRAQAWNDAEESRFVLLTERAKGQTEAVRHCGLDYSHDCHFQSRRP